MTSARSNVNVPFVVRFFVFVFVLGTASALLGIVTYATTAAAACSVEDELEHERDAEEDSEPETEVERIDAADSHGFGDTCAPGDSCPKGRPASSAPRIASRSDVQFVPHSDSNAAGKPPPR